MMNRSLLLPISVLGVLALLPVSGAAGDSAYDVFHLHAGGFEKGLGTLRVADLRVGYVGLLNKNDNFNTSCAYFLAHAELGAFGRQEKLTIRLGRRKYVFVPLVGVTTVPYKAISDDCASTLLRRATTAEEGEKATRGALERLTGTRIPILPEGPSYPVVHSVILNRGASHKQTQGTLSVRGLIVHYSDSSDRLYDFSVACSDFEESRSIGRHSELQLAGREFFDHFQDKKMSTAFPSRKQIYDGITAQCSAALNEQGQREARLSALNQLRQATEATERAEEQRRIAEAQRVAKETAFRDSILKAWRAAEEREAFTTIRGDYNLSSPDSRHWKTTLDLPDADECYLLRNTASAPTQSWTYVCQFPGTEYERLVNSVQSVLGIAYQPDQLASAASVNQVFFSDPSRPSKRLVLTKIQTPDQSTVLLRIGANQQVSGPPDMPGVAQQGNPGISVVDEIAAVVKSGRYAALPTPVIQPGVVTPAGSALLTVQNETAYTLTVLFSGPGERRIEIAPRSSTSVNLTSGTYKVLGRVNASNVLPSYGEHQLAGAASIRFYIQ